MEIYRIIRWGNAPPYLHILVKGKKYYWKRTNSSNDYENVPTIQLEKRNCHRWSRDNDAMIYNYYPFKESDLI